MDAHIPGRIEESHSVLVECAIDRIQDREFSEGLDGEEQHGPDDDETEQLRNGESATPSHVREVSECTHHTGRTTGVEGAARTNKQTSTDGTTCDGLAVSATVPSHPCETMANEHTDGNHLHVAALECSREATAGGSRLNIIQVVRPVPDVVGRDLLFNVLHGVWVVRDDGVSADG